MPQFKVGDMFEQELTEKDILLVTCNSYIRTDGALVMGRGAAKEMRDSIKGIDKIFGDVVLRKYGNLGKYGVILVVSQKRGLGVFQVKHHFKDKASLDLIKFSVKELIYHAERLGSHIFHLNFPGIGNGRLNKKEVLPLLTNLPDNVIVWERI